MAGVRVAVTEADWQDQVVGYARLNGWRVMHVRKAPSAGGRRGRRPWSTPTSEQGWPDLFMWHEKDQRVLAAELKVRPNKLTNEQADVLWTMKRAGIETQVWFPEDWPRVTETLARRPRQVHYRDRPVT